MTDFIFNKKLVFIYFILILLLTNGCKEDKINELDYISIEVTEDENKFSLLSCIEIIGKTELEMTEHSLFSLIDNICFFENEYYIFDSRIGSVFVFDGEGNYKRRIGNKGQAPGELLHPVSFVVNSHTNEIEILDSLGKKILQYTLDGKFIAQKDISDNYLRMYISQNAEYLFLMGYDMPYEEEYMLSYCSSETERKILPITEQIKMDGNLNMTRNTFSIYGEDILFWKIFNDTIYRITTDPVIHKIHIDFGKRKLPEYMLNTPLEERAEYLSNPELNYILFVDDVIGFENKLLFSCISKEGKRFFIHDFTEKTSYQVDMGDLKEVRIFSVGDNQFVLSHQTEDAKMEESIELIHFRLK